MNEIEKAILNIENLIFEIEEKEMHIDSFIESKICDILHVKNINRAMIPDSKISDFKKELGEDYASFLATKKTELLCQKQSLLTLQMLI